MNPTVAVIGLGSMGSALAHAFRESGALAAAYNRTRERAQPFEGHAVIAADPAEAIAHAELIVISLPDYVVSDEVLRSPRVESAVSGKTILQLTSGSPGDAREADSWARSHGAEYLDAAILSYPSGVGTPGSTVFYSGREDLFRRHEQTLSAISPNSVFVGEAVGLAAAVDCAILETYYAGTIGFLHGAAICESEGMSPADLFAYKSTFLALIDATADMARGMLPMRSYAGVECSLDTHVAAIRHLARLSRENGIDTSVPDFILAKYSSAAAAGHGGEEIAVVYETLRSTSS